MIHIHQLAHSWFTSVVDSTERGPVYPFQLKPLNYEDREDEGGHEGYSNNPWKLTGVSEANHLVQITLTPKQAGLVWPFFKQNNCFGQFVIH